MRIAQRLGHGERIERIILSRSVECRVRKTETLRRFQIGEPVRTDGTAGKTGTTLGEFAHLSTLQELHDLKEDMTG